MDTTESDVTRIVRVRRMCKNGAARQIREAAGLSQPELARACGATFYNISRWERGHNPPRAAAALRYLAVLEELTRL